MYYFNPSFVSPYSKKGRRNRMADCTKQFNDFIGNINLTDTQIETLRKNRDALRSKISNYFSENNLKQPDFCWQGSFSMGTTIKDPDANYDLDDGIYLNHLSDNKEDWPSAEDMHDLIVDSVKNHTSKNIQNKRKCVRVQYADNHHIDLAIYGKNDEKYYLAVKGDLQWEENSAKSFKEWFDDKRKLYGDDFIDIIKILKKWAKKQDYKDITGFYITILAGNNFAPNTRIDLCLKNTIENILSDLKWNYKITRPVEPKINLTEEKYKTTDEFNEKFIVPFETILAVSEKAINETSLASATKLR